MTALIYEITFGNAHAKAIAVKLADNANDDGESIFPAKATIARKVECSKRTVDAYMNLWLVIDLLRLDEMGGGRKPDEARRGVIRRKGRTSVYSFNVPLLHELEAGRTSVKGLIEAAQGKGLIDADGWATREAIQTIKGAAGAPFETDDEDDTPNHQTVQPVHPSENGKGCSPRNERVQPTQAKGAGAAPEPSLERQLNVKDSLPLPLTGFAQAAHKGGRDSEDLAIAEVKASASGPVIKFGSKWDHEARSAITSLVTEGHPAGTMIAEWCGTLNPPKDTNGAAWVSTVVKMAGHHGPEVLKRLSDDVLRAQFTNVPFAGKLAKMADEIAKAVASEIAVAAADERKRALERAALQRLAPGIEPDAVPARQDAIALRRVLVETVVGGAALDEAWLTDLLVIERTGPLLQLSVGNAFAARYIASSQMHSHLVESARRLWPQVQLVDCVTHDARKLSASNTPAPINAPDTEALP